MLNPAQRLYFVNMRSPASGAMEPILASLSASARDVLVTLKKRGEARAEEIAEALGITPDRKSVV